ncbi:MAG TPA: PASTA domain-containing protein, partial [Planctomycetota bacterium]|nr:PASTA domain-containing protein [Planctomycetota bacterium]
MARRPVLLLAVTLALGGCTGGARARPQRPEPPAFTPPAEATSAAVPDVRGMAMDAARAALESAGFLVGLIEPWPDSLGYAAGTVVAQRPGRAT